MANLHIKAYPIRNQFSLAVDKTEKSVTYQMFYYR